MRGRWSGWATLGAAAGAVSLGLTSLRVGSGAAAPPEGFSSVRAREIVDALAVAPHPLGTEEHDRVRDRIVARLEALGLTASVERAIGANPQFAERWGGPTPVGRVQNIVARIEGAGQEPPLVLVAHYDSAPHSPGAADDASGVAAVLEVARATLAGPPPPRDVILLLTDGEEAGLLGARAWVAAHAEPVSAVVNLEARGRCGPALLFETVGPAGPTVSALARSAEPPLIHSLFVEIYRALQNDTDLSAWRGRGAGVNLAFVDGLPWYHTALDRPDAVCDGSIHQLGTAALAAVRAPTGAPQGESTVFMPVGRWPIAIPAGGITTSALAAGFVAAFALRRRDWRRVALASVAAAGLGPALAVGAVAGWQLLTLAQPVYRSTLSGDVYGPGPVAVGLGLTAACGGAAAWAAAARRLGPSEAWAGGMVVWAGLLALAMGGAPGAAYLPLIAVAGCALGLATEGAWAVAAALPLLVVIAPLLVLLRSALGMAGLAIPVALVGLTLSAITPVVVELGRLRRGWAVGAAIGLALALGGAATARFDADHPRPGNLLYLYDADAHRGRWATTDPITDDWTRTFVPEGSPEVDLRDYLPAPPERAPVLPRTGWAAPAPDAGLVGATVEVVRASLRDGLGSAASTRSVVVRIASSAPLVSVHAGSGPPIRSASIDGVELAPDAPDRRFAARYWTGGAAAEPFELHLELEGAGPLELRIGEVRYGWPTFGAPVVRPAATMPVPFMGFVPDATFVQRTVTVQE